jgi:hypothetical protein
MWGPGFLPLPRLQTIVFRQYCRILADLCILFSSSRPASRLPPAAAGYQQQTAGYLVLSVIMPLKKSVEGIL